MGAASHDTITYFDPDHDVFQLWYQVTGVDTPVIANISNATIDADPTMALGAAQLAAHHAVIVEANANAPSYYRVIDANGVAGYQAGQDLVVAISLGSFSALMTANFIT